MAINYCDFFDAQTARSIAMGQAAGSNDILAEVNILQLAVDAAATAGTTQMDFHTTTTVTLNGTTITGSPMTIDSGTVYYNGWTDPATYYQSQYVLARAKMDVVVGYFSRLGYSIRRYRDGTANNFYWSIMW
jgi:hypothetical protein